MPKSIMVYVALIAALLLTGCSRNVASAQPETPPAPPSAFDSARSALGVAYGTVAEEAEKLTHRSTRAALSAARKSAVELQSKLAELQAPSSVDIQRLQTVQKQIERLDAAILVQSLKAQWESAIEEGRKGKRRAKEDVAAIRARLREDDEAFRVLDDQLVQAERAYADASNRLLEAIRSLEKSKG